MSLIQEALRRRDEESGGGPDRIPPRVVLPIGDMPSTGRSSDEGPSRNKRSPLWGVLAVLLTVGLLGALAALGWFFYKFAPFLQSAKAPVTTPLSVEPTGTQIAPVTERTTPSAPSDISVTSPVPKMTPVTEAERPSPVAAEEKRTPVKSAVSPEVASAKAPAAVGAAASAPLATPAHPPEAPVESKLPADKTASPPAPEIERRVGDKPGVPVADVKTVPVAVAARTSAWPRLTLNGVMAQTGPGQGSAIINGTVVEIGEKIEGVRLLEVQRNGVLLEFRGNTQFVRVGQSTY